MLADVFVFYGGLGSELKGETVPFNPKMLTLTLRQPLGVVGAIIPWNVPLLLMALKIAPALVAGNSVVVKTAEEAPLAALRAAQIMNQILPPGVFNLLTGYGPECGGPLVAHKDVRKVTFTGSVETGRIVYKTAAEKLIPVTLELGGKSPMIVMEDADLDKAIAGAVVGMRFTRQGQSCTAASRMFVHEAVHDTFVEKLKAKVDAMKMGDPLDEATDIGSIISAQQYERVTGYIKLGRSTPGAVAHECSAMPKEARFKKGLFVRPVIFTGIDNSHRIAREEIFGPVTAVIKWRDYEEVIAAANNSEYGLAATVWTNDLRKALDATHRLEAGFVQVNQNLVVQPGLSYGGSKHSGLGREASLEVHARPFHREEDDHIEHGVADIDARREPSCASRRCLVTPVLIPHEPVDNAERQNGRSQGEQLVGRDGVDVDDDETPDDRQHGNDEHGSQPNDALLARQDHEQRMLELERDHHDDDHAEDALELHRIGRIERAGEDERGDGDREMPGPGRNDDRDQHGQNENDRMLEPTVNRQGQPGASGLTECLFEPHRGPPRDIIHGAASCGSRPVGRRTARRGPRGVGCRRRLSVLCLEPCQGVEQVVEPGCFATIRHPLRYRCLDQPRVPQPALQHFALLALGQERTIRDLLRPPEPTAGVDQGVIQTGHDEVPPLLRLLDGKAQTLAPRIGDGRLPTRKAEPHVTQRIRPAGPAHEGLDEGCRARREFQIQRRVLARPDVIAERAGR